MKNIEEAIESIDRLVACKTGNSLSFIQKVFLRETLSEIKKTYAQIAQENNYSEPYIKQWVAPKLWKQISDVLGEKVNKTNCSSLLETHIDRGLNSIGVFWKDTRLQNELESPEGKVPLESKFYIEREKIDRDCDRQILQPGALIRIKGGRKTGKTSLASRILACGERHNYRNVWLNFHLAEAEILTSPTKAIRWVCANVTQQLGLDSKLPEYWHEDMGNLVSCTLYFQEYLFKQISEPIVLAFDEVDRLFDYPQTARDFFALLRSWHEKTKDSPIWQKLRVLVLYSTDFSLYSVTPQSPLTVGMAIDLSPFTPTQVSELARRYGLELTAAELKRLVELTGGLPYLVRVALDSSVRQNRSLTPLLQDAATDTGIFARHLSAQLWNLQKDRHVAEAFQQVLLTPTRLEPHIAGELKRLGLVRLEGNRATVSCELYRQYFGSLWGRKIAALDSRSLPSCKAG
ncbi:AAA-like domain-containing protein [Oscillatoriales cyanobacterium LEGE 11467]|uniref:AAA-like domain-containing protein n=1 Tax=Zarconia navalis LEGE 11467 TaxID=1828826 RepID=A0A928Z841_9CYAN|nr:AAA-like domain-containing protein [Zarconia navalis LEGE 11467]